VLAGGGTDIAGGDGVSGSLPNFSQGWGLASIPRTLDTGPRFFWDQQTTFGATGDEFERVFAVQDPSKRVRVTLAWTDPPGPTFGNSFVNNLDLTVGAGSGAYKGNVFAAGVSDTGGTADPRNNLESVYLPAGTDGNISVSVTAANIAGNGVPGNPDPTDQDFALVVSNAAEVVAPVLAKEDTTVTPVGGDADAVLEPGERFNVTSQIKNLGNATATGVTGALDAASPLTITDASTIWPDLVPEQTAINANPLSGRIDPAAPCGAPATMSLAVTSAEGASSTIPIPIVTGLAGVAPHNSADVPKAIPDNNPVGVTSTVAVASPKLIQDVNVRVGSLTHTFVGDLRIELTSPSGTTVVLANRPGGNLNGGNDLTNTVFDDEASTAIGAGGTAAPYTGSFKPQADELSRFDGESQQGTWTLKVSDLGSADTGTLQAWRADVSLRLCDFVPPPPPGQPTGLVATPGLGSVALEWGDTPGATSYEVFRRTGGGGYSAHPVATPGSSSFTDGGRTAGEQYCYRVGALNDASPGPLSAEQCATALGPDNGGGGGVRISVDLSSLPRSVRVSRKRTLTLRFGATAGQAGVITLRTVRAFATARRRKLVVARKSFSSPASGRVRVKLKLTRRGFRVLKRKRRLAVAARVTLGEITAAKRVTLRAPRPRPRR
jgi:subtilisin-like proprotein convertase family protein